MRALDECSSSTNIFQGLDVEGGHPEDGRREVEGGAADRSADGDRGAAERDRRLPRDGPTSGARRRRVHRGAHGRVRGSPASGGRGQEQEEEEGEGKAEEEERQVPRRRQGHRHERTFRHDAQVVAEEEPSGGGGRSREGSGEEDAQEDLVHLETGVHVEENDLKASCPKQAYILGLK